jgi:hypothetical protein
MFKPLRKLRRRGLQLIVDPIVHQAALISGNRWLQPVLPLLGIFPFLGGFCFFFQSRGKIPKSRV